MQFFVAESLVVLMVGAVLVLWLGLTIAFQFDRLSVAISRFDAFRLIPRWTFFSPNPGHHDIHLVVRDKLRSGIVSDWAELHFADIREAIPLVWNPEKRIPKVLWDCWTSIQYLTSGRPHLVTEVQLTGAYIVLLNISMKFPKSQNSTDRQFALVRSEGFQSRNLEVLFVSAFHTLTQEAAVNPNAVAA